MKSFFMVALLSTVVSYAFAQWNPNGATTGNIYYSGGNVGIGLNSPLQPLHISGAVDELNLLVHNTSLNGARIFLSAFPNKGSIQIDKDFTIATNYDGWKDRFILTHSGIVGIGTLNPYSNSKFHVKAAASSPWTILAESSGNGGVIGMSHNGDAGQISVSYLGNGTFSPLQFRTSNLERMTILPNGNVGIGITEPIGKLDINYAGGQLRLSGGTVAGGVWTNASDVLYLADWNTASKGISINMTNGDVKVGSEDGTISGYGAKLHLLGNSSNGDALWMSRYNNGDNKSELRVNIGDDFGQQEDMFTVGTHHWNGGEWKPHLSVHASGKIGIGTTNPTEKLTVKGTIYSTEVKVDVNAGTGPDYVFEPTYQLPSLTEIENYIKANKHLPEVPSAKEMETNGINLSEMNMLLLKKVEELTLYLIEVQKNSIDQQKQLIDQRKEIEFLKSKVK